MLRVERAIYLSLTMLAVFVYWRSFVFIFRWLPIVYCGGTTQTLFDWYSLMITGPLVPFAGFFLALLLARRNILTVVRRIIAAATAGAAGIIARIFEGMMIPGIWGDCQCCGPPPTNGPRDIRLPFVIQIPPAARSWVAISVIGIMCIGTLAILIAELRAVDRRGQYFAVVAVSLLIFSCAGWLITRAPYFIRSDVEWRYAVILTAIAAIACLPGAVTMARKSIGSLAAAFLLIVISYVTIYHAVGFFTMVAE